MRHCRTTTSYNHRQVRRLGKLTRYSISITWNVFMHKLRWRRAADWFSSWLTDVVSCSIALIVGYCLYSHNLNATLIVCWLIDLNWLIDSSNAWRDGLFCNESTIDQSIALRWTMSCSDILNMDAQLNCSMKYVHWRQKYVFIMCMRSYQDVQWTQHVFTNYNIHRMLRSGCVDWIHRFERACFNLVHLCWFNLVDISISNIRWSLTWRIHVRINHDVISLSSVLFFGHVPVMNR